jgi:hypothetical protein
VVLQAARPLGFIALAILAVIVWFAMAPSVASAPPDVPSAAQYERLISQALSDNEANEARTDSAPQQQVVNGWVARDLLSIIAKANADMLEATGAADTNVAPHADGRVPTLLVIAIVVLAWDGLTRDGLALRRPPSPPDAMSAPA